MRTTHCIACNKELINRRPQTLTCNAACRARHWRHSRIKLIKVSIMLNLTNHTRLTEAAGSSGKSINQYVHDRVVRNECSQC